MTAEYVKRAERMLQWLREAGGHAHPSATFQLDDTTGLSLFSTDVIPSNERLISCPFAAAVTPALASKAVAEVTGVALSELVWPAGSSREGEKWNERMRIGAYIGLHWVWEDKVAGKAGPSTPSALAHGPYIDALPLPDELTTPLYFNEAERELLTGTNLLGAVDDRVREWQAESAAVRVVLREDGLTWERYLAVATYLSSRAFPSRLLRLPDGASSTATGAIDEDANDDNDDGSHPVLLPGVDMLNHARGQPILWLSSLVATPSGDVPAISLMSAAVQPAGAQIFNNYGAKPNEELLLGYGFVLDSNPDDTVVLRLGSKGLPAAVQERLDAKDLDAGKRFTLGRDGELDQGLLEVLRVMLGDGDEDDHDHDDDNEDEHAAHANEEKGLNLELDVLGMIGEMLEDKLEKLQSGPVDVDGARKEVVRMCAVYRQGQVDILESALDKLDERVKRIEGLLDESVGCPCGC